MLIRCTTVVLQSCFPLYSLLQYSVHLPMTSSLVDSSFLLLSFIAVVVVEILYITFSRGETFLCSVHCWRNVPSVDTACQPSTVCHVLLHFYSLCASACTAVSWRLTPVFSASVVSSLLLVVVCCLLYLFWYRLFHCFYYASLQCFYSPIQVLLCDMFQISLNGCCIGSMNGLCFERFNVPLF